MKAEIELAETAKSNDGQNLVIDAIHTFVTPTQETVNVARKRSIADYGDAPVCPTCSAMLELGEGCLLCRSCGWSKCG